MTAFGRQILLTATLGFNLMCIKAGASENCAHSRVPALLNKSICMGYQLEVLTAWTELQCLDNCIRHPHCDKYIFNGKGNQNCKILRTEDIADINLPNVKGMCAPTDIKALNEILLGTKDCPELKEDGSNNKSDNGGAEPFPVPPTNGWD